MGLLQNLYNKVKSSLNDNEGWFRQGKFTPVTQMTGKPLIQQQPMLSPIARTPQQESAINWNTPETYQNEQPAMIQLLKPSFKTQAAEKLNSRLDQIKRYGSSIISKTMDNEGLFRQGQFKPFAQIDDAIKATPTAQIVQKAVQKRIQGVKDFGTGIGKSITTNWDANKILQDQKAESERINKTFETVRKLRDVGKNDEADFLVNSVYEYSKDSDISKRIDELNNEISGGKKKLVSGAIKTAEIPLTMYAGAPKAIINMTIGGLLSHGISKLSGDTPEQQQEATATGINDAFGYTGIVALITNPLIERVLKSKYLVGKSASKIVKFLMGNPVTNQIIQRTIGGLGNVGEDKLLAILDSKEYKSGDFWQSLAIGGALTGNDNAFKNSRKLINKYVFGKNIDTPEMLPNSVQKFFGNQYRKVANTYNKSIDSLIGKPDGEKIGGGGFTPTKWIQDGQGNLKLVKINPQNGQVLMGGFAGLETYQDESGQWQVRFNPENAALGMMVMGGVKTKVGQDTLGKLKLPELKTDVPEIKAPEGITNFTPAGGTKVKPVSSIRDILNTKTDIGTPQPFMVKGVDVSSDVKSMIREGWQPHQIDYAVKLANKSKVEVPDKNWGAYIRGILKDQSPAQAAKMGRPLPPEPAPADIVRSDRNVNDILTSAPAPARPVIKSDVQRLVDIGRSKGLSDLEIKNAIDSSDQNYDLSQTDIKIKSAPIKSTTPPEIVNPRSNGEVVEPKVSVKIPIAEDISSLNTVHPPKADVMGKTAEEAYKNLNTHGVSLVDRITTGLKRNNVNRTDFVKYVENPELTPSKIRPLVDTHRQLMKTLHGVRENLNLGKIENYFPHMDKTILSFPPELKNLGEDLWVSDFTTKLGSSKTRTGSMIDYSTEYNQVMKNYVDQVAYDKYGKKINATPESVKFDEKVQEHLSPQDKTKPISEDNLLKPPSGKFNYIKETTTKNKSTTTPITSKAEIIDSFDGLKRKIATEPGQDAMVRSMEDLRDAKETVGGLVKKLDKFDTKVQIELLNKELTHVGKRINIKDKLNIYTQGGKKPIPDKILIALLKAEKDYRLQDFIDEAGKHTYHPKTEKYLNQEIDRLIKKGKYEQTLFDKAANFITSTFYKAQIWGNANTGVKQKLEDTRLPVLYSPQILSAGVKQAIADTKTGDDILERYNFSGTETNISKQLGYEAPVKTDTFGKAKEKLDEVGDKINSVGNFFVNVGENSKNRDFLYAAEAQGKSLGLAGDNLTRFVRNELFSNGFILHEFNTPWMLNNPLVRLGFQYQQYNIKLLNKVIELSEEGGIRNIVKAGGLIGSQVASLVILGAITGKGIDTVKDQLGIQFGPTVSTIKQIIALLDESRRANEESDMETADSKIAQAKKLVARNTIPFGNQYFKSADATKIIIQGHATSSKGNVRYATGELSPLDIGRAVVFGQGSIPNAVKNNKAWDDYESGKSKVRPILTRNQSAILRAKTTKKEQLAYFDKIMASRVPNQQKIKEAEEARSGKKPGLISSILKKKKTVTPSSIADILTSPNSSQADKTRAKSEIKAFIDEGYGADPKMVKDADLKEYFYGKVDRMPESSASEKQVKSIARFKKLNSIYDSETLDQDTKDRLIKLSGISSEDVIYYNNAKDNATVKAMRQEELAGKISRNEWMSQLEDGRKLVGDKQIIDNPTLKELYERGLLSDSERDYLIAVKYDPATSKYYIDRDYKNRLAGASASTKKKQVTALKALKTKLESGADKSRIISRKSIIDYLNNKPTPKKSTIKTIGLILSGNKSITPTPQKTGIIINRVKSKYRFTK